MSALMLYQLTGQFRELEALADSDDLPPEVIRDTLEGLTGELEVKAISVAAFTRNLEASADMIDEAAKAMQTRARRLRARAESVKAYLLYNMQAACIRKIESPEFTLAIRTNPPAVVIREDAEIPAEYMVQPEPPPPRPDKKRIGAALKAGVQIDGCWLEQGERLEIKA